MHEAKKSSNLLSMERWLRKSFYDMETADKPSSLGLSELKKFMLRINYKVTTSALKERFSKFDSRGAGQIGFDGFTRLVEELLFDRQIFKELLLNKFSTDGKIVTLTEFQKFLAEEQVVYCNVIAS